MEFLLPPLRTRIASGGDADVAAACQTLGGISLRPESGKQAEKRRASEDGAANFFLASLSILQFGFWLHLNAGAAAAASFASVHLWDKQMAEPTPPPTPPEMEGMQVLEQRLRSTKYRRMILFYCIEEVGQ